MQVIDRVEINGAELVLAVAGEHYEMLSPITGKHSVRGSRERALTHWHGFVAANKEVPVPFAVYQKPSGKRIWYYEVPEEPTVLYFHEGERLVMRHSDLKNPTECKILSKFTIDLLDSYHAQDGFVRLKNFWQ